MGGLRPWEMQHFTNDEVVAVWKRVAALREAAKAEKELVP